MDCSSCCALGFYELYCRKEPCTATPVCLLCLSGLLGVFAAIVLCPPYIQSLPYKMWFSEGAQLIHCLLCRHEEQWLLSTGCACAYWCRGRRHLGLAASQYVWQRTSGSVSPCVVCVCVRDRGWQRMQVPLRPEDSIRFLGASFVGASALPNMGTWNWFGVLWMNSNCWAVFTAPLPSNLKPVTNLLDFIVFKILELERWLSC